MNIYFFNSPIVYVLVAIVHGISTRPSLVRLSRCVSLTKFGGLGKNYNAGLGVSMPTHKN